MLKTRNWYGKSEFNHAMDEIRDLQRQIQVLGNDVKGSNMSMQTELSSVKTTMESVLRKETLSVRNRSISLNMQETTWTTSGFSRSPLINEILPEFVVDRTDVPPRPKSYNIPPFPKMLSAGMQLNGPPSPGMPSPGLPSPGMPSPTYTIFSESANIINVPPAPPMSASLLKFASIMVSGHMVGMLIPNLLLRVFVLGCITDVCMLAFASPHLPSSAEYLLSLWRSR